MIHETWLRSSTKAEVGHDAGKDGDDYDLVVGGDKDAETGGEDGDVGAAGANHGPAVKSRPPMSGMAISTGESKSK